MVLKHPKLTWGTAVHKSTQSPAILPIFAEVAHRDIGKLVLDPSEQTLFRGLLLGRVLLILPLGHGDGVVENQRPYKAKDQLQIPIHNGLAIWKTRDNGGDKPGYTLQKMVNLTPTLTTTPPCIIVYYTSVGIIYN